MAWGDIKPDRLVKVPQVGWIGEYLLKNHGYNVPGKREGTLQSVYITALSPVYPYKKEEAADFGQSMPHIKKILACEGVIPHYVIAGDSWWQLLDAADCWQRADGKIDEKTIGIAITMSDQFPLPYVENLAPMRAGARLTGRLLKENGLSEKCITVDRNCPEFFHSRWKEWKQIVREQMKKTK